jgi:hypothetical protein
MANSKEYNSLIENYHTFIYNSYFIEEVENKLVLHYQYIVENNIQENIIFNHRITYELKGTNVNLFKKEMLPNLDNLIFTIGLIESINYWKTICSPRFIIRCGQINEHQKNWWKKLFYNGLGEFIYLNKLDGVVNSNDFVNFYCQSEVNEITPPIELNTEGNLIPIGGGKDSVVTLELLERYRENNICFVLNPPEAAIDCINVANYSSYILANRYFDKQMLKMNKEGFLNGHVPYSAILAFISLFAAAITNKRYITLSNEKSANEPSVIGTNYNHQYSKSFEFEEDFNEYVSKYILKNIHYFSLLRAMYEIEIAEEFTKHKKYHSVFRSCNRGKKDNSWCSNCAKCLFVYIILAPYMELNEVNKIFGGNMLENESLEDTFKELMGLKESKPFECVGTIDEVRYALKEIVNRHYPNKSDNLPILLQIFIDEIDLDTIENVTIEQISSNNSHLIPDKFIKEIL